MDVLVPSLEARIAVSKWRLELFYHHWGESQNRIPEVVKLWYGAPTGRLYCAPLRRYIKRQWLVSKTRALVEHDRLFMPDGPGAISRIILRTKP